MSSTPSSTSSSASATDTTPAGGGIFDVTGSQPLILVFLAVGLFSAISIAILGWRRAYCVAGRRGSGPFNGGINRGDELDGERVEDRPKMWDLWTKVAVSGMNNIPNEKVLEGEGDIGSSSSEKSPVWQSRREGLSWGNITPITASPILREEKNDVHNVQRASNTEITSNSDILYVSRGRRQLEAITTRFGLLRNRETQSPEQMNRAVTRTMQMEGKRASPNPADDNNEDLPEHESLEIAVAIAMPKRKENHTPELGLSTLGETAVESGMYEYAIGVCRVPRDDTNGW